MTSKIQNYININIEWLLSCSKKSVISDFKLDFYTRKISQCIEISDRVYKFSFMDEMKPQHVLHNKPGVGNQWLVGRMRPPSNFCATRQAPGGKEN